MPIVKNLRSPLWPRLLEGFTPAEEPDLARAKAVFDRIVAADTAGTNEIATLILNEGMLNKQGVAAKFATLAAELKAVLVGFLKDIAAVEVSADRLIEVRCAFRAPELDTLAQLRYAEIRASFAKAVPGALMIVLLSAAEHQDAISYGALVTAPPSMQKLDQLQLDRAAEVWARKSNLRAYRAAGRVREAASALRWGLIRLKDNLIAAAGRGALTGDAFQASIRAIVLP